MDDQQTSGDVSKRKAAGFNSKAQLILPALRALVELMKARVRHFSLQSREIHALNRHSAKYGRSAELAEPGDAALVDKVAFVVPRVALYLPWRSDCLIQAMAGQCWLSADGIASSIVIGVDLPEKERLDAHAWLQYGEQIVTGGDISNFKVLFETK